MATNYKISFENYYGNPCEVKLIEDYEDDVFIDLMGDANPVQITYDGEEESIFSAVVTSKARIRVKIDGSASNQAFIERMAALKEGEYQVEIQWALFGRWVGALIPDEQTRSFSLIEGTLELTAVDRLIQMKGKKLVDSDGAYLSGDLTLRTYIERCFNQVLPPGAPGLDTMLIYSSLVLSNDTAYSFPSIMEQLSVYAEVFNDDMGRPVSCYDVIKIIAESLCMRCFYVGNFLFFVDILDHLILPPEFGLETIKVGFKDGNIPVDSILIKNSENITTVPTYTESICRFEFKGLIGLLVDGYLQNWVPSGGGFILNDWTYSPLLLSAPDYENRRVGNGRQENPYGILLKGTVAFDYEEIGGHAINEFYGGDTINVQIKMRFRDISQIVTTRIGGTEYDITTLFRAVIYNETHPEWSYYLKAVGASNSGIYEWKDIDLLGTTFAANEFDFAELTARAMIGTPYGPLATRILLPLNKVSGDQTISVDLPPLPLTRDGIKDIGRFFFAPGGASSWDYDNDLAPIADLIVQNVIVSKAVPKTDNKEVKGEIVYVSRAGNMSVTKVEKTIKLNTSANWNVAGSLRTPITYTLNQDSTLPDGSVIPSGTVIPAGPVYYLSRKNADIFNNRPLIAYNAMVRTLFDYNQYKIDYETKGNYLNFNGIIDLSSLYDEARPSTEIYQSLSLQIRNTIDIKAAENKITSVTMKVVAREFTQYPNGELDETHDLIETYNIT